ncbi:MAG: type II secretion system protein GspG [Phycisphaerales bacterium]|nr:type II secretion system protein GspG [Phycisphaerales bacterium]MCB9856299.1 type II secretion system protein GspG [Phycisphaerales bacterium]MCB9863262.1 type II secretion system protein GspG [Phycisphaerales bacterium]
MPEDINTLDYAQRPNGPSRFTSAVQIAWTITLYLFCVGVLFAGFFFCIVGSSPSEQTYSQWASALIRPTGPILQAVDLFRFNMGRPPSTLGELMQIADDAPDRAKWTGPYLNNAEGLNDRWGHPFQYQLTGAADERQYHLWSVGPNGIDESSDSDSDFGDDIRNWN